MDFDFLCLGTGTSSCLPTIGCLLSKDGCHCCKSSQTPEGRVNLRRNTSGLLRIPHGDSEKTVLIDCGKSFYTGAVEHWPRKNLRQIDALILTHPHSDAVLGLDDLRGWTLGGSIQKSIDIYSSQHTFNELQRAFPYLIDANKATGGGDVPQFNWIVFHDTEPFNVCGVNVTPLPVHHGRFFDERGTLPYVCHGFLFNTDLIYMSDVSHIPDNVWATIEGAVSTVAPDGSRRNPTKPRVKTFICDSLRLEPHMSHFGFPQALEAIHRVGAHKSYLVGFGHRTSHALWADLCACVSDKDAYARRAVSHNYSQGHETPRTTPVHRIYSGTPHPGVEDSAVFVDTALEHVEAWNGGLLQRHFWLRPSCDGMTVRMAGRDVPDDDYYN